jgi:hypothetical protein
MRKKFHIVHLIPQPTMHGLKGYREVIETVQWGLLALGHEASVETNKIEPPATNIVLGFQMLPEAALDQLPPDTIVYNFEQLYGLDSFQLKPAFRAAAQRFQVWEYSERNLPVWKTLGAVRPVLHVPVGWAPILVRIPPSEIMDIDVLFYGLTSPERLTIFHDISMAGIRFVFACGLYGGSRDHLIARSKLILNLSLYKSRIFEVVRASYLFANAKAVVSEFHPDMFVEPDLRDAAIFTAPNKIAATCRMLLDNEAARINLEKRGEELFRRRDVRQILRTALDATFAATQA